MEKLNSKIAEYLNEKFKQSKNAYEVFRQAKKDGVKVSLPTVYKRFEKFQLAKQSEAEVKQEPKQEEVKQEVEVPKEVPKVEAPKVEIKSETIEKTAETGAVKLDASDVKVEIPQGEQGEAKKEEAEAAAVDTGQFTAIVVEMIDGLYKRNGITPLDADEKQKGYAYTEAVANNRLKYTSKYADIINVIGWGAKTVIKRIPEFIAKSKVNKAAPVEPTKQETAPSVTGASDWSKMSPMEIMKKIGPNI